MSKDKETELSAEERKARFLRLAGIWSETEEGEEQSSRGGIWVYPSTCPRD